MAATPSVMIPLGFEAPDFSLYDTVSDTDIGLEVLRGEKGTLITFICNHCPYVIHIQEKLVELSKEYQKKGVETIFISSNDIINYPDDAPDLMKVFAEKFNFSFPYLFDEDQQVAKAYSAVCTPDFFLFDEDLKCCYRGQFDASRPKNDIPVTGVDLRKAMDNLVNGLPIDPLQYPSIGCNIKWKSNDLKA